MLLASDAVRTNNGFKNAEFADIIKCIMAWLRTSGDREGGRKRRREAKLKKQTDMIRELQQQVQEQQRRLHEQQIEVLTTHSTSSDIDEQDVTEEAENLCLRRNDTDE